MKFIVFIAAMCLASSAFAQGTNSVNGYYKKDGTYVEPHYRTNPDHNINNNWSTQGNTNPYTGQAGTVNPYGTPSNSLYGNSKSNNYR